MNRSGPDLYTSTSTETSWITIPDVKHRQSILHQAGYLENPPQKAVQTPKRKRNRQGEDGMRLNRDEKAAFMSGAGSGIYLASDIEFLAYGIKECAIRFHAPTRGDELDYNTWQGSSRVQGIGATATN